MTNTAIDICSRALVKLGANSLSSFDEETTEAHISKQLYEMTLDSLLAAFPWRFSLQQTELGRLANSPNADYQYAFALPSDCIRVLSAGSQSRGQGLKYRLKGGQLHTDSPSVILTYIYRPTESEFPAFFTQALVAKLAAEFCLPLTESTNRTDYLRKLADEEIKAARLIDSQQSVPQSFQDFSLIEVRS